MRIYISGKITGTDDYMTRFAAAEERLTQQGYSVVNPAAVGCVLPTDMTHKEYMSISLVLLDMCDAAYMLQGWKDSPGACMECGFALARNKIIELEEQQGGETSEAVCPYDCKLREYEQLDISPEQIREIDRLYAAKCREVAELEKKLAAAGEPEGKL